MAFLERRVVLVGDPGIGRSSLIAVRRGDKPFLNKRPPYFGHTSFEQSVTDLEWEGVPDLLKTTRTTLKRRRLKRIRQTQLHVINVDPSAQFKRFRPYCCYPSTTVVVFCFSIGNERSFENIRNKVSLHPSPLPRLATNNPLGVHITRANALGRFSGTPKFGISSRVFPCCSLA